MLCPVPRDTPELCLSNPPITMEPFLVREPSFFRMDLLEGAGAGVGSAGDGSGSVGAGNDMLFCNLDVSCCDSRATSWLSEFVVSGFNVEVLASLDDP